MTSLCHVVATVLMILPAFAAAEPVTLMIGPEIRYHLSEPYESGDYGDDVRSEDHDRAGGLVATVAYPLTPQIALGIHVGAASRHYRTDDQVGVGPAGFVQHHDHRRIIADLAVTVQFTASRLWAAPWFGRHISRHDNATETCMRGASSSDPWECRDSRTVSWSDDYASFGLTAGVDVVRLGPHNIAAFVDAEVGVGNYRGVSAGVGYRLDFGAAAPRSVAR